MADDLNSIAQQLDRVQKEAEEAQKSISALTAQLERLLAASSKGGIPTQTGISRLAQELIESGGASKYTGYKRTGGGAYAWIPKIEKAVNDIVTKIAENNLKFLKAEESRFNIQAAQTIKGIVEPTAAQKQSITATGKKTAEEKETERAAKQQQRDAQRLAQDLEHLRSVQSRFPEAVSTVNKMIDEQGLSFKRVSTNVTPLTAGIERLTVSFRDGSKTIGPYKFYVDELGVSLTELEAKMRMAQAKQKTFTQGDIISGLGGGGGTQRGAYQYQQIMEFLRKRQLNFQPADLKKIVTQEPTGVSFLTFEKMLEGGTVDKLQLSVDRFGKVLVHTNRRLLDFFSAIARNTAEVIRWSVGATAVYQALFKLQDLVRTAIDNEAKLADVTVTLAENQRTLRDIFDDTAKIANETGESLNGVIEAYTAAYRAVGSIEDPVKRTTAANQLLSDSIILSKLSSLDQAQSIDVLAGSLRQLNAGLDESNPKYITGTKLLDQWVAVTRKANVDLATLATAFSITSESAENAGVSTEELTGIIAALSEKIGGLGGRETGNAVRALIGGVYQGQAKEALGAFNISIEDTTGQMRSFLDISKEINTLWQAGIIRDDQLNKLAYTLGGGVRRGQQYVAFLTDLERIQEIVAEQANASGSAQDALAKKLDTVQTASTRLSNSFQELAMSLGEEGGVLDTAQGMLNIFTAINKIISELTQLLGRITIPAALLAFSQLYFRGQGGQLRKDYFNQGIGGLLGGATTSLLNLVPGMGRTPGAGMMFAPQALTPGAGGGYSRAQQAGFGVDRFTQQYGMSLLLGAGPAISRGASGQWGRAAVDIGGAIAGAFVTGGQPAGAIIGSLIAEKFVSETLDYEAQFANFFKDIFPEVTTEDGTDQTQKTVVEQQKEVVDEIFKNIGLGSESVGKMLAVWNSSVLNIASNIQGKIGKGEAITVTPEQAALRYASPEQLERIRGLQRQTPIENVNVERAGITQEQVNLQEQYADQLTQLREKLRQDQLKQLYSRDINAKGYTENILDIQGFDASLTKMYTAFGEAFDTMNTDIEGTQQTFETFADIILKGGTEDTQTIKDLASEIFTLNAAIEELNKGTQEFYNFRGTPMGLEELKEILKEDIDLAARLTLELQKEQRIQSVQLPSTITLETNKKYLPQIMERAQQLEDVYVSNLTPDEKIKYNAEKAVSDTLVEVFTKGAATAYERIAAGGPASEFIQAAFDELVGKAQIPQVGKSVGLQKFDMPYAQFMQQLSGYEPLLQKLEGAGYQRDEQYQIAMFQDGIIRPMSKDWKIVQFLLQEILDTEKKQLEGVYNLPADASFYVPYQGYKLGFDQTGGGMGGMDWQVLPGEVQDGTYKGAKEGVIDGMGLFKDKWTAAEPKGREWQSPFLRESKQLSPYLLEKQIKASTIEKDAAIRQSGGPQDSWQNKSLLEFLKGNLGKSILKPPMEDFKGPRRDFMLPQTNMMPKVETKLTLNINSTTQLMVDGRMMAAVIKQYLYQDLLRSQGVSGSNSMTITV